MTFRRGYLLASCLLLSLVQACNFGRSTPDFEVESAFGYRPIYVSAQEAKPLMMPPQEMQNAGKIYVLDDYLLVVDKLQGVHIFDNSDPANPENVGFLRLAGSTDIAIRDGILYADQYADLLAIDISDPTQARLTSTVKGVLPFNSNHPEGRGDFECVDPSKGIVIGWEQAELNQPKCYR